MTDSDSEYESETSHAMGSMGRKKKEKRKEQQYRIFKVQISSNSQSVASYYDFEDASECKGANHGGRGNDQSIPLLRIHPNTPFHAKKYCFLGRGYATSPDPSPVDSTPGPAPSLLDLSLSSPLEFQQGLRLCCRTAASSNSTSSRRFHVF